MIFFLPLVPARITNISKDITVNEGSNVNLMCLAVGRPEANIIWKHHSPRGTPQGLFYSFIGLKAVLYEDLVFWCIQVKLKSKIL